MTMTTKVVAGLAACLVLVGPSQAQTCNPNVVAVAPNSRYIDHGNGTVTDTGTGLMWKQCIEGLSGAGCATNSFFAFSWEAALKWANSATFAGYSDWRLPNVKELASLVEERCYMPAINATLFPNTPSTWHWTSSPNTYVYTWIVHFEYGHVESINRAGNNPVRLVRGGQ